MSNKYRFLFLLLGIGIGIILTSFVYYINPFYEYKEYTDDEIVEKAKELGMVFVTSNISTRPDDNIIYPQDETLLQEQEEIEFIVESGDTSEMVSKKLEEMGIIEDCEEFRQFVRDKGMDKGIRVGAYRLSSGLDYDTILYILTKQSLK